MDSQTQSLRGIDQTLRASAIGTLVIIAVWVLRDILLLAFASVLLACILRGASEAVRRTFALGPGVGATCGRHDGGCRPGATGLVAGRGDCRTGRADERSTLNTGPEALGALSASEAGAGRGPASERGGILAEWPRWLFPWCCQLGPGNRRQHDCRGGHGGIPRDITSDVPRGWAKIVTLKWRWRAVAVEIARMLQLWFMGQLVDMIIVALLVGAGLFWLGVPLAPTLALFSGLLNFVPYVGALAGAVPAILVALSVSPSLALWVALLFFSVQMLEGNVIAPLIQKRTISLPPALTIFFQTILGTLFGVFGLVLATPLVAMGITAVRMIYVEGILGDFGRDATSNLNRPALLRDHTSLRAGSRSSGCLTSRRAPSISIRACTAGSRMASSLRAKVIIDKMAWNICIATSGLSVED